MPEPARIALAALTGYLLGSVSFAWLLARVRGVDLRAAGSGNLGATNAGRVLGRGLGLLVFLLDAGKGALAAWLGCHAWTDGAWEAGAAAGGGALLGHVWPVFMGFRGGKGVATLIGSMTVLAPAALALAGAAMLVPVVLTRYMSLGSLVFALALPVAVWILARERTPVLIVAAAACPLLWYTHRTNIARLLRGEERRLGRNKPA
ncbi:MAG: glycerol-3-phosphate 1-O-acyltransferase [Planctomycetota bacterium]|nr:MAG: glycerol-3-phosphate 1-O-acyltransferase [Planctomycetota bacterium]